MEIKTKENMYEYVTSVMTHAGFSKLDEKQIEYGIQLVFGKNGQKEILRIYSGKNGVKLDVSQVKNNDVKELFGEKTSIKKEKTLKTYAFPPMEYPFAGSDEAGKGDYFGPMVVCCVLLNEKEARILEELGVKDSKKISDRGILLLANEIRKVTSNYNLAYITPQKINTLHATSGNINSILAFLHGCAIKGLLEKQNFERVVIDRFAKEEYMENQLSKENLSLFQTPKAESYIPVAAASILARNQYVEHVAKLQEKYDVKLPFGAGEKVIACAKTFLSRYGREDLDKVAKTFFKTTQNLDCGDLL